MTEILAQADFGTHPYEADDGDVIHAPASANFLSHRQLARKMAQDAAAVVSRDAADVTASRGLTDADVRSDEHIAQYRSDLYSVDRTAIVQSVLQHRKRSQRERAKRSVDSPTDDVTMEAQNRAEEKKMVKNLLRKTTVEDTQVPD